MYSVIADKTNGHAALKARSAEAGQGWEALRLLYQWYKGVSGLALQDRLRRVIHPQSPRKIEDVSTALEDWVRETAELAAFGEDYLLKASFKMLSLSALMSCRQDQYDSFKREAELKSDEPEGQFDHLLESVREYANRKRLEFDG